MSITLRHLRYFEALCRHRHFGKAAEECAVTQPALSVQIQEFEAAVGIPLIERRRGQFELTRTGEEIAHRAARIILAVGDLKHYALASAGELHGPLQLGVIPTVAPYLLARLLPALRQQFPLLELTIFEAQTDRLLEVLKMGRLDAAIISVPVEHPGLEQHALFDDGFVLATHVGSELAGTGRIEHSSLPEINLLLLDEGHCLRDQALSFCRIVPQRMREKYGAAGLGTLIQLVANGQGATVLPEIAITVEAGGNVDIVLRRFAEPQPQRTIGLAWRETSPRSADFRALGDVIAKVGQEVVDAGRKRFQTSAAIPSS